MRFGVIADTHGWLDPQVLRLFAGVDQILLAGDIGGMHVVEALQEIAPVVAVRGNNDMCGDCSSLPDLAEVDVDGVMVRISHFRDLALPGAAVAVFGHSHKAEWREIDGAWLMNPGAAGRRGFHRERFVALLEVRRGAQPRGEHLSLGARSRAAR